MSSDAFPWYQAQMFCKKQENQTKILDRDAVLDLADEGRIVPNEEYWTQLSSLRFPFTADGELHALYFLTFDYLVTNSCLKL